MAVGLHAADWGPPAQALLTAFLGHAGGEPLRQLEQAVALRAADPALTRDEKSRLARAAARVHEAVVL